MITIKEIAKLSGVSIATVSKIVNNKASDISQDTINKVLDVVKKFNYSPYGTVRNDSSTKTFIIAVILRDMVSTSSIVKGLIDVFNDSGYSLILFSSNGSEEVEMQNINKALAKNVDGLLWQPLNENSLKKKEMFKALDLKVIYLDAILNIDDINYYIDYSKLGYFATEKLIEKGHTNLSCVIKNYESTRSQLVMNGFKKCLFDNCITYTDNMIIPFDEFDISLTKSMNITGFVSSHFGISLKICNSFLSNEIRIPEDISLISLCEDENDLSDIKDISCVKIPNYSFGEFIGKKIISLCEDKKYIKEEFDYSPEINCLNSISVPYYARLPKIVVVGSINIDNNIYLDNFPDAGQTKIASECISIVGGKALNQAIGVSLLKKDAVIIGKIGKDDEARTIRKSLGQYNLDTSYLITDDTVKTSKAFITINSKGESTIAVSKGANNYLSIQDIKNSAKAFYNAGICLLQSEIPLPVVKEAAAMAKKNNALTIMKPSTISKMSDDDYENIDIFVPNRKESLNLSKKKTVEEAAEYFYKKGIKNVIITLDKDGALLKNSNGIKRFKTNNVMVIDSTGGSDAFISALACQLIENKDIEYAIKAANIAGSYCVSKFGASNSMIDYETLERTIKHLLK